MNLQLTSPLLKTLSPPLSIFLKEFLISYAHLVSIWSISWKPRITRTTLLPITLIISLIIEITFTRNKHTHSTRILQWNCCGIRGKLSQLQHLSKQFDILCIQDTLLFSNTTFRLPFFQAVRKDADGPGQRGICILLRNNIIFNYFDLTNLSHPSVEIQGISLNMLEDKLVIINIYRHPNKPTPLEWYRRVSQTLSVFKYTLVVGNFNAHNTLWGCPRTDGPGKALQGAVNNSNACVMNDGNPTFLTPPGSNRSVINIITATVSLAPLCDFNGTRHLWQRPFSHSHFHWSCLASTPLLSLQTYIRCQQSKRPIYELTLLFRGIFQKDSVRLLRHTTILQNI